MGHPTHEDAELLVQLSSLYVQSGGADAGGWMWSDAFVPDYQDFKQKFPPGSEEFKRVTASAPGLMTPIGCPAAKALT
jgi:hypothetical protein